MKVSRTSVLARPAEAMREALQRAGAFVEVSYPLVTFRARTPLGERLEAGDYEVDMKLFGVIPLGRQTLCVSFPQEPSSVVFRDRGHGTLARVWDHLLLVEAIDEGHCRYTDEIEVRGRFGTTILVWIFAHLLFAHRHRRWRRLTAS